MRAWCFFILLLVSGSCMAQDIDPFSMSKIQVNLTHSGFIRFSSGQIESTSLELLMPQNTSTQTVFFEGETLNDSLGNRWLYIYKERPGDLFSYDVSFLLNSSATNISYLPENYSIPEDVKVYLRPAEGIPSEDPEIRSLAISLTRGKNTDFDKVCTLAAYVYDVVEYDIRLREDAKDALWVLENKRGTCDEFTTLFIALARSVGIPARFVVGHYYGNTGWQEHAFAEVYLGEWIPVDPTNLAVSRLDAAHIVFAVSEGNRIANKRTLYGRGLEDSEWVSETDIRIINTSADLLLDYDLSISSDEFYPGDTGVVVLRLRSPGPMFLRADIEPCVSNFDFLEALNPRIDKAIFTQGDDILYWVVQVNSELEKDRRYTCPLTVNSRMLTPGYVNLTVYTGSVKSRGDLVFDASLSDSVVSPGNNQTVFLNLNGLQSFYPVKVGIVSDDFFTEFTPETDGYAQFSFRPSGYGKKEVLIYTSTGLVKVLEYSLKAGEGIYLDRVLIPDLVRTGVLFNASLLVRSNYDSPRSVTVVCSFGETQTVRTLDVANYSVITFPLSFEKTGFKNVSFEIIDESQTLTSLRKVRSYGLPDLSVSGNYAVREGVILVELKNAGDVAKNVVVHAGNLSISLGDIDKEKAVTFKSSYHPSVEVSYESLSGETHTLQGSIVLVKESLLDKIIDLIQKLMQALLDFFSQHV